MKRLSTIVCLVICLFAAAAVFGGCGEKSAVRLEVVEATVPAYAVAGGVNISAIKIRVYYSDETSETVNLSGDMLEREEAEKLHSPGKHTVKVKYLSLSASFDITLTDGSGSIGGQFEFENLVFSDKTFVYDGEEKFLTVENAPEGAVITYEGNGFTDAGEYIVGAKVEKAGYKTAELSARVTVRKAQMSGVTFAGAEFVYDGAPKTLTAAGYPEFSTVLYENNTFTDAGVYEASVTVKNKNYEDLTLSALLTINPAEMNLTFVGKTFVYDGEEKYIYVGGLPEGAAVRYTGNGAVDAGVHRVKAEVQCPNYRSEVLFADITIEKASVVGVLFSDSFIHAKSYTELIAVNRFKTGWKARYCLFIP